MPRDSAKGHERALKNRAIRQDEMRRQLSAKGLERHVIDMIKELRTSPDVDSNTIARYRVSIDGSMRLINKYLPDLKSVEHSGEQITGLADMLRQLADTPQTPAIDAATSPPQPAQAPKTLN